MNFDENHNDNHGLQHSVAILERLYTDVDYPKWRKKWPNLEASPYDLDMSRADLWAFAGKTIQEKEMDSNYFLYAKFSEII